jgi:hypothetical protein
MKGILTDADRKMTYKEFTKSSTFDKYVKALEENVDHLNYPLRHATANVLRHQKKNGTLLNPKDYADVMTASLYTWLEQG